MSFHSMGVGNEFSMPLSLKKEISGPTVTEMTMADLASSAVRTLIKSRNELRARTIFYRQNAVQSALNSPELVDTII